jgi:hypothetical protein
MTNHGQDQVRLKDERLKKPPSTTSECSLASKLLRTAHNMSLCFLSHR